MTSILYTIHFILFVFKEEIATIYCLRIIPIFHTCELKFKGTGPIHHADWNFAVAGPEYKCTLYWINNIHRRKRTYVRILFPKYQYVHVNLYVKQCITYIFIFYT